MAEKSIDLNKIYQYYISQGVDPTTAAQYTSYYALNAKQTMSIKNPSQLTWKPPKVIAPTYTSFAKDNDPFIKSIYRTLDSGTATLDQLQSLANSPAGIAYAKKKGIASIGNLGEDTPGTLSNLVGKLFYEYQDVKNQEADFDFWASNSGLPDRRQKYKFSVKRQYNPYREVEYKPARQQYTTAYKKYAQDLQKAGFTGKEAAKYLQQFNTEFETYINKQLSSPNFFRTPFTDAAMSKTKGGK